MFGTKEFLEAIWGDKLGEIREIPARQVEYNDRPVSIYTTAVQYEQMGLESALANDNGKGWAIYFGVTPRFRRGGKDIDCIDQHDWIWQDFDVIEGARKSDALERALAPLAAPSILVDSGGGIQAYWRLTADSHYNMRRRIMEGIAKKHGGDHTYDKARVMRLPGFDNHKYGVPMPARILRFQPEQKYTIDAFQEYIEIPEPTRHYVLPRIDEFGQDTFDKLPFDLRSRIAIGAAKGRRSEVAFGVVCGLIKAGWSFDAIEDLFKSNEFRIGDKYKEKGMGTRWLAITYANALSSVTGTQ